VTPTDLHAAIDEMLPVGIPQSNVRQELPRLIRGMFDVTDVLEAIYPLGHTAREYLRSPVWIIERILTKNEPKEASLEELSRKKQYMKRKQVTYADRCTKSVQTENYFHWHTYD
jgi:hypothetical protein